MPSPTTAMTAMPGLRGDVVDEAAGDLVAERLPDALTARSASASGSVKPIELSDDAWKIVETDSRSASTAANVRAAMPCTPTMPLPATVTIAWPRTIASALTG